MNINKKTRLVFSLITTLVLGAFIFGYFQLGAKAKDSPASANELVIETKDGTRHVFKIDLAITPEQQQYGLMNRTSLPPDYGMLFVFEGEAERSFWMKNTLIPLDVIFIKKNGTIHHIHENAIPHDLTTFTSQGPVMAGLEVMGGTAERLNLQKGDKVHHLIFESAP